MGPLFTSARDLCSSVFEVSWNPPSLKITFTVPFIFGLLAGAFLVWIF